jgi:integrase
MGELRFLRSTDINFKHETITVQNHSEFTTKSKKSRTIPLHKSIKKDLRKLVKANCDQPYVFLYKGEVYKKDRLSGRFKKVVRDCELNDGYHFHSLRHTFASWLVQKGVPLYTVSKLLGHADLSTTQIYAHLKSSDLRNAVENLD